MTQEQPVIIECIPVVLTSTNSQFFTKDLKHIWNCLPTSNGSTQLSWSTKSAFRSPFWANPHWPHFATGTTPGAHAQSLPRTSKMLITGIYFMRECHICIHFIHRTEVIFITWSSIGHHEPSFASIHLYLLSLGSIHLHSHLTQLVSFYPH